MNVQRFLAPTSREAMAKARSVFGDSAVILSSRSTGAGFEVVATAEENLDQIAAQHLLGPDVEDLDYAIGVSCNAGEVGAVENGVLQGPGFDDGLFQPNFSDTLLRCVTKVERQVWIHEVVWRSVVQGRN